MRQKSLLNTNNNEISGGEKCNSKSQVSGKNHLSYHSPSKKERIPLSFIIFFSFLILIMGIFLRSVSAQESPWTTVQIQLPSQITNQIKPDANSSSVDPEQNSVESVGWVPILSEGFEGDFPGEWFVFDNNGSDYGEYYWAKKDCRSFSGNYSAWPIGAGAEGSLLSCGSHYPDNANSWMIYGPFSLEDATDANLSFKYWLNSEASFDYIYVLASIDGSNFYGINASGEFSAWQEYLFNLTDVYTLGDLTGQPQVWITFAFVSDSSVNNPEGAYVDDIFLQKYISYEPPTAYAYINQPWDWIDGIAEPQAEINAELIRNSISISTASTTTDENGVFSFHFLDNGNHIDLEIGDEIIITGGGLSETLELIDITGWIDRENNRIEGQALGGTFPTTGVASVGQPSDLSFVTQPFDFSTDGSFTIDFNGIFDIDLDHLAKVDYTDPAGNKVVQLFNPQGLDIRVLTTEGRVEGVTNPGEEVSIQVYDSTEPDAEVKASATTIADQTGFYSTLVYNNGYEVDLELGDHIEVKNSQRLRSTTLTMFHTSIIEHWDDRIIGQILGVSFPEGSGTGRVDIWSQTEQKWFTQYVGIGPEGQYDADFSNIVDIGEADIARIWVTLPDGNQQAALGWGLHIGASISDDEVWGFTRANSDVYIELYQGLDNGEPVGPLASQLTTSDYMGYFSTQIFDDTEQVLDLAPSNVIVVIVGTHKQTMGLFLGEVKTNISIDDDLITINGPRNTLLHLEGRREGVLREDAPYQQEYVWKEVFLNDEGNITLNLSDYDIKLGDWFDLTCYLEEQGWAIHTSVTAQPLNDIYLPIILK